MCHKAHRKRHKKKKKKPKVKEASAAEITVVGKFIADLIDEVDQPVKRRKTSRVPLSEVPAGDIPTLADLTEDGDPIPLPTPPGMADEVAEVVGKRSTDVFDTSALDAIAETTIPRSRRTRKKSYATLERERIREGDPIDIIRAAGDGLLPMPDEPPIGILTEDEYVAKYGHLPPYPESGDEL